MLCNAMQRNELYCNVLYNVLCNVPSCTVMYCPQVEEIVPAGTLDADEIHTPGIYVSRVVQGERMGVFERLTLADKKCAFDPVCSSR